jgi:hypothetical protein
MDSTVLILLLVLAAGSGIGAALMILRRDRLRAEAAARESPFAVSTEGMSLCPTCGFGNHGGDRTCASCGAPLP